MPTNPKDKDCVSQEMHRWKSGELHSGVGKKGKEGKVVPHSKSGRRQAIAIALSTCGKSDHSERLTSLGFSQEVAEKVLYMLYGEVDWEGQHKTGKQPGTKTVENNRVVEAQGLPNFDIDGRGGKQPGDQGKHKEQSSLSISAISTPKANPYQGPSSRSDLKGLALFEELKCPKPRLPKDLQPPKPISEQPQNQPQGVTPQAPPKPPKPEDEAAKAERARKRALCDQQRGAGSGAGAGITTI